MLGVKKYTVGFLCTSIVLFSMHAADQSTSNEFGKRLAASSSSGELKDWSDPDFFTHELDSLAPSDRANGIGIGPFRAQRQLLFLPDADMVKITESPDQPEAKRQRGFNAAGSSDECSLQERVDRLEQTVGFLSGILLEHSHTVGSMHEEIEALKMRNKTLVKSAGIVTMYSFEHMVSKIDIGAVEKISRNNIELLNSLEGSSNGLTAQAIRLWTAQRYYHDFSHVKAPHAVKQQWRHAAQQWLMEINAGTIPDCMRPLYDQLQKRLCGTQSTSILLGQFSLI